MARPIHPHGQRARYLGRAILAAALLLPGALVSADDGIRRWVDVQGVTHFTDEQFAPPHSESVHLEPANGMVAPRSPLSVPTDGRPSWTLIALPEKRNAKGWRPRRESLYTGRKHQDNRRRY